MSILLVASIKNPDAWELIASYHPLAEKILGWIRQLVDILQFSRPFSGSYKGLHYYSDLPPTRKSCVMQEIRIVCLKKKGGGGGGAVRVWGQVGVST